MRRSGVLAFTAVILVVAVVTSTAASGYVVILKNGHKIRCREPMQIEGNAALLTLITGVLTSYPLDQVDIVETERYNKQGLGSALLIEELTVETTPVPTPTPRRSLGHYATVDAGDETQVLSSSLPPTPTPTPGIKLQPHPYHDERVIRAFSQVFDESRLYIYRLSAGTRPDYLFIQTVTDSEREVFHSLRVVAEAFALIHQLHSDIAPEAVELEMIQTSGKAAGTFRIDLPMAEQLITEQLSIEQFYVKYVIF